MAGVIDVRGVQWEHCNGCGDLVKLHDLGYLKPTESHPGGLDLCVHCVDTALRIRAVRFSQVQPAATWKRQVVKQ